MGLQGNSLGSKLWHQTTCPVVRLWFVFAWATSCDLKLHHAKSRHLATVDVWQNHLVIQFCAPRRTSAQMVSLSTNGLMDNAVQNESAFENWSGYFLCGDFGGLLQWSPKLESVSVKLGNDGTWNHLWNHMTCEPCRFCQQQDAKKKAILRHRRLWRLPSVGLAVYLYGRDAWQQNHTCLTEKLQKLKWSRHIKTILKSTFQNISKHHFSSKLLKTWWRSSEMSGCRPRTPWSGSSGAWRASWDWTCPSWNNWGWDPKKCHKAGHSLTSTSFLLCCFWIPWSIFQWRSFVWHVECLQTSYCIILKLLLRFVI